MKRIEDIEKLSLEQLERIGSDESISVPGDLSVRLPRRQTARWGAAASLALLLGLAGWTLGRNTAPKDSFDDPYLAYAAIEEAFGRISHSVHSAAGKINDAEDMLNDFNYWK